MPHVVPDPRRCERGHELSVRLCLALAWRQHDCLWGLRRFCGLALRGRSCHSARAVRLRCYFWVPPPSLYKLRPRPSYSRRRGRVNLGPSFNSVPNVVQPHKTWVW